MNTEIMGEQMQDANMEDSSNETVSGPIDVAPEAHDAATETSTAAATIVKLEDNNGSNTKDESATKLDKDKQSNATINSTDPVTEVEDDGIDYYDGTYGEAPEIPSPDVQIIRLQNDKINLQEKTDVLKNQVAILKGDKRTFANSAHARMAELQDLISTQHTAITNANNRITAANNNNAGKQRQLDSLYATLTRQGQQLAAQAAHINAQAIRINALVAHINTQATQTNTMKSKHNVKLHRIKVQLNKMVRVTVKKYEKQALANSTAIERFGGEMGKLIYDDIGDPEATESEEEEDAEEDQDDQEQEMVVIDLSDDDDEDQVADEVQPAAVGAEQDDTVQQPTVGEQRVIAEEPVASEESPSKRVKLTQQV
jgi:uncharacterized phage infection (PIP) family protein YhgE